jgi:hypothetical protein
MGKADSSGQERADIPPIPVGRWILVDFDGHAVPAFTYVDAQAGFSAAGFKIVGDRLDEKNRIIFRLPQPIPWRPVSVELQRKYQLEETPGWVAQFYGPQPVAGTLWGAWRTHPHLAGRFLPDYPDDLQVVVHDGGPRLASAPPEVVWVSVRGVDRDLFQGRVLNQPHNLKSVSQGSLIQFIMPASGDHPILVTDKYLAERGNWIIKPCNGCGLAELFDAPSDLIALLFPDLQNEGNPMVFTSFCPQCGGVQLVQSKDYPPDAG